MSLIDFEFLFRPVEELDAWLTGLFAGAPLLVALGIAFVLGLRHASDPDHLVAVTSLVAADDGGTRSATRLGAWWGVGHAAILVALGVPLIVFKSALPTWLESGAEKAVGVVIILLALRVTWKWARGHYRAGRHAHAAAPPDVPTARPTGICAGPSSRPRTGTTPCEPRDRHSASACCTGLREPGPSSSCCSPPCQPGWRQRSAWRSSRRCRSSRWRLARPFLPGC